MGLKPLEEVLHADKEINKHVLARIDILSRLTDTHINDPDQEDRRNVLTKKRTPIPAKIALAGAKA
jgi:hypothetical protein